MNNKRRKRIDEVIEILESAKSSIEEIMDEEQEAFDNLPESLQYSDKGSGMESAIGNFETAKDQLDEAINELEASKQ